MTEIVESVTGQTLGEYVKEKILDPLNMSRTRFKSQEDDNIAFPHAIGDDMTSYRIAFVSVSDETGFAGATGARSSIKDLLSMYQSLLFAYKTQLEQDLDSTAGSPLKQVRTILSPHIRIDSSNLEDMAYCFGLYRTRLPNNLGMSSMNNLLLGPKRMPLIGSSSPGLEIFYHAGNVPGSLASTFLLPSSQSAVVVLANSLPLMDPTDFVGQLIMSPLVGEQPPSNLLELCKLGRSASMASYEALSAQLEKHKTTEPPRYPLAAYEGDYINAASNFVLSITRREDQLLMTVQNMPLTKYELFPYDGDTFYWPTNRNSELKQCMWPVLSTGWHKITFGAIDSTTIDKLVWKHDPFARPEVFRKRIISGAPQRGKL